MGNPVPLKDGVGQVTYEYKGKIFNLCCPGCIEAFKADPERYSARVEKNS
jgi:YHS domain-containing protein